ncbi:MAG: hypothetical protein AAGA30_08825 [Planctomycetota bacterium]
MNELEDIKGRLQTEVEKVTGGVLTTIRHEMGITCSSQIAGTADTFFASKLYGANETYVVAYIRVNGEGRLVSALQEDLGVLPDLFYGEDGEIWCRLTTDTTSEKELEIIVPILERSHYSKPKGRRPFAGTCAGRLGEFAIFHDVDIFSTKKPDKLLKVQFKKGKPVAKLGKLPLPSHNKVFFDPRHGIQLIAFDKDQNSFIQRVCDIDGAIDATRSVPAADVNLFETLEIGFDSDSRLILCRSGEISIGILSSKGDLTEKLLIELPSSIYSTWTPVAVGNGRSLMRFTFEKGNGWLIVKGQKLLDCLIHDGCQGYRSLINNRRIEIPCNDLVITGASSSGPDGYCVSMHPRTEHAAAKELYILHQSSLK